MNLQPVT